MMQTLSNIALAITRFMNVLSQEEKLIFLLVLYHILYLLIKTTILNIQLQLNITKLADNK